MKQGQASSSGPGARKREPIPHAVSPAAVSQIGEAMGNHVTDSAKMLPNPGSTLYQGRGYEAPAPKATTVHHGGSQGRHD